MVAKFKKQKFKVTSAPKIFRFAKDDLYAAEILVTAPKCRPEIILYHIQQCIEKSVIAVLIHREQAVILTHDIDILLSELPSDLTESLPSGVGELTQFATIRRYTEGDEIIEKKDLTDAIEIAHLFKKWAEQILS